MVVDGLLMVAYYQQHHNHVCGTQCCRQAVAVLGSSSSSSSSSSGCCTLARHLACYTIGGSCCFDGAEGFLSCRATAKVEWFIGL